MKIAYVAWAAMFIALVGQFPLCTGRVKVTQGDQRELIGEAVFGYRGVAAGLVFRANEPWKVSGGGAQGLVYEIAVFAGKEGNGGRRLEAGCQGV